MHTNGDTKRQSKRERRTETVKETAREKKKRLKRSSIWVMTDTEDRERENDIHVLSDAFQLYLDNLARLLIWHSCQESIFNWTDLAPLWQAGKHCYPPRVCTQIISINGQLLWMCCSWWSCADMWVYVSTYEFPYDCMGVCVCPCSNECVSVCFSLWSPSEKRNSSQVFFGAPQCICTILYQYYIYTHSVARQPNPGHYFLCPPSTLDNFYVAVTRIN